MGDFSYPAICWENNTAVHNSSSRFLECIEDCFLLQTLNTSGRYSALLGLLRPNREDLLDNITTNSSLGYNNRNTLEFVILLSRLKTSNRTKTMNFRKASFSMLWAQLQGILWAASIEGNGPCESSELFKSSLLEAQEQFIPYKGKESLQN